jgi:hypothetical protein
MHAHVSETCRGVFLQANWKSLTDEGARPQERIALPLLGKVEEHLELNQLCHSHEDDRREDALRQIGEHGRQEEHDDHDKQARHDGV